MAVSSCMHLNILGYERTASPDVYSRWARDGGSDLAAGGRQCAFVHRGGAADEQGLPVHSRRRVR